MPVLEVYYDKSCPLCRAEIDAIRAVAPPRVLQFIDCSAAAFDDTPLRGEGVTRNAMMRELHARDAAGAWYRGVDAFVQLYQCAGLPQIARFWGHPRWGAIMKRLYPWVARNRYWLSRIGLPALTDSAVRFCAARAQRKAGRCASGACAIGDEP